MPRNIIYIFLIAITTFLLYSCSINKISRKERALIPYKVGQKIVFVAQGGKTDTIYIIKEEAMDHTATMALVSDINQSVNITARVPNPFTNVGDRHFTHSHQSIAILHTDDRGTYIDIHLEVYGHPFISEGNNVEKLKEGTPMTLGGRNYNDIIIFECNNEKACSRNKAIRRLYWSREYGIVQYTVGEEEWNYVETIN